MAPLTYTVSRFNVDAFSELTILDAHSSSERGHDWPSAGPTFPIHFLSCLISVRRFLAFYMDRSP